MVLGPSWWGTVTLGIFVEGTSDSPTIPILIRKLGYGGAIHTRIVRQGNMLNLDKMSKHIAALTRMHRQIRSILIFIDSEGVDPSKTLRRTRSVSVQLNQVSGRVPTKFIVVDHSLEGWLACDVEALKTVLGKNATVRIGGNPEDHLRPATTMDRVFQDNRQTFKKTVHNQRIAKHVTPANILEKSPTFRHLADALGGRHA
jgi:hypothetical protein